MPKPYKKSISPSILFEIQIGCQKYEEAIIGLNGWLETDDGKIIQTLNVFLTFSSEQGNIQEIGASGSAFDDRLREETEYRTKIIAQLSKQDLNYIENRRTANKKGDVELMRTYGSALLCPNFSSGNFVCPPNVRWHAYTVRR